MRVITNDEGGLTHLSLLPKAGIPSPPLVICLTKSARTSTDKLNLKESKASAEKKTQ